MADGEKLGICRVFGDSAPTHALRKLRGAIRQMSAGALSGGGFDPARDILAITVNRWPHGFAIGRNSLFDTGLDEVSPTVVARQKFGRIAIANSDASGMGAASTALYEAHRAVSELQVLGTGLYETF